MINSPFYINIYVVSSNWGSYQREDNYFKKIEKELFERIILTLKILNGKVYIYICLRIIKIVVYWIIYIYFNLKQNGKIKIFIRYFTKFFINYFFFLHQSLNCTIEYNTVEYLLFISKNSSKINLSFQHLQSCLFTSRFSSFESLAARIIHGISIGSLQLIEL